MDCRGVEIVHEYGRHAAVTTFDFRPGLRPEESGDRIPEAFRTVAAYLGAGRHPGHRGRPSASTGCAPAA